MAWLSLKLQSADDSAELLSDALMSLGALSVSIEDANAETPDEQPIFGEPGMMAPGIWQQSIVSALFNEDVVVAEVMQSLTEATGIADIPYSTEMIEERDWVRATQSQFDPIRIRDDLWIVPSWHEAPNPDALNIVLDPGLAFGTGSHPTTHLCLTWLADHIKPGCTVLDYGCGSGILAIAAKKLGAAQVIGIDIDAQAIQASQFNALQNDVAATFLLPDEKNASPSNKQNPMATQYDWIVANILSSALSVLAPLLASACKPGGEIALSGILREQLERVSQIYAEWFEMYPPVFMDDWVLLTGKKLKDEAMLSVTSCPNCETSFVVTQSQLAAHSGKVRCSNCNHVFNASEWLIEVPADSAEGFGRFGSVAHQPAILSDLASTRDRIQMPEQKKSAPGFYPALIAGLTLMLILQTTIAMRSQLAGKWPETKPFLGLICNVFSCAVTLPQEVDLLAIDDLELREDAERQGLIRLSSTLINSAKFAQAFPMLELSLTGADDKVLIRRIFSPGEYLPAGRKLSSGIAAGEDLHINLAMKVIDVPVAGYRMFILYP